MNLEDEDSGSSPQNRSAAIANRGFAAAYLGGGESEQTENEPGRNRAFISRRRRNGCLAMPDQRLGGNDQDETSEGRGDHHQNVNGGRERQ